MQRIVVPPLSADEKTGKPAPVLCMRRTTTRQIDIHGAAPPQRIRPANRKR
jgi:hypothetical protein